MIVSLMVVTACSGSSTTTPVGDDPGTTTTASTTATTQPATSETTAPTAESVEVTIPTAGLELTGTLRLPAGETNPPAVVLIHGSGPQSRDSRLAGQLNMSFGFEIPVFAELADALQDNGVAVLTYDKRSCGPFNGCAENAYPLPGEDLTIETFIDDARAAVEFLRQRPEIDPERVSVAGHSQGAQFVLPMLEMDPQLASGVMIAGPFRAIDEITEFQLDSTVDLLVDLGLGDEEALALPAVAPLVDMVDGLAGIRAGSDEPVAGVSAGFWQSWFDLHERSASAALRIDQPVLVLNGELDWNVPSSEAQLWDEFLGGAGADYQVLTFPCITHALNCVSESDPTAITPGDIGRAVAAEVTDALVEFLAG